MKEIGQPHAPAAIPLVKESLQPLNSGLGELLAGLDRVGKV
jgi:hypothetical protein